ncbi:hypothetical protein [Rhodococcus sp. B10]|uniref:hypothetical protein n=1 Tax=Rhodococcus sp. B10 TaxID=2695876 RepID=UPI001432206D|nr:hypothetical protein [Rhodococcus sp. B10]NIL77154.1 hypothetical protein [Rhodococcus sp. B10]
MRKRIDNRELVVTWLNSESLDDVAKAMGRTRASVQTRASELRKRGVKLPKFTSRMSETAKQLEVAQLNSIISKHQKEVR